MQIEKIDDKIYFLRGSRSSNIYYFDCEKKAIIDTGHPDEIENNIKIFKDAGFQLEKVDYIINTHSHGDHNGANAFLKKINPNIKIFGSPNTEEYQNIRKKTDTLKEVEDEFEPYQIDIKLNDKDKINLGEYTLEAIETKGHTRDSISYYIEEKGYIFSGDTFYYRVITQLEYYQSIKKSIAELTETYDKLKKNPLKLMFTGHGEPIKNPIENLEFCLRKLKKFQTDNDMALINNLIPSVESFVYRNQGVSKEKVKEFLMKNLSKIELFITGYEHEKLLRIVEKILAMVRMLNMVKFEGENLYLNNKLNEYIGIIKV